MQFAVTFCLAFTFLHSFLECRVTSLRQPRYVFKRGRFRNALTGFEPQAVSRAKNLPSDSHVKLQWITQKLDHFDPTNNETWQQVGIFGPRAIPSWVYGYSPAKQVNNLYSQRCWTNEEFYEPGGPQFLLIGGEYEATPDRIAGENGFNWIQQAKRFRAACFYLEHRYYGESRPKP
ncbi:unnamed protein product [Soboliphyme baturini]|uniref:Serine carboxypeptidase n=1 Tax=Soboliphyme baturini TaxID=241478 RepID=A0A183J4J7_9BILA|nr:unnamed protein product [Soboliphyme baturini]